EDGAIQGSAGVAVAGRVVTMVAFHQPPSIVPPAGVARRLVVDFLPVALPDVGNVKITGEPVEAESPRIAQPLGPDLIERVARPRMRVVRRDAVGLAFVLPAHVDAEHLPQPGRIIL